MTVIRIATRNDSDFVAFERVPQLLQLIRLSEYSKERGFELLEFLGFIRGRQRFRERVFVLAADNEVLLNPLTPIVVAAAGYIWFGYSFVQLVLVVFAGLLAYHRWDLAERNRNVEEAIGRRGRVNDIIRADAALLIPHIGNVFDRPDNQPASERSAGEAVRIDMYVFAELDSLEYIFLKAQFGLMLPNFAVRAIQIFVARVENEKIARGSPEMLLDRERGGAHVDLPDGGDELDEVAAVLAVVAIPALPFRRDEVPSRTGHHRRGHGPRSALLE